METGFFAIRTCSTRQPMRFWGSRRTDNFDAIPARRTAVTTVRQGQERNDHHDRRTAARLRSADDARSDRRAGAAADRRAGRGQGLRRRSESGARHQQLLRQAYARQQNDAAAAGDFWTRSGGCCGQGRRAGLGDASGRSRLRQSGAILRLVPDVPQRPDAGLPELDAARLFRPLAGHHAGLSLWRARAVHHRAGDARWSSCPTT